MKHDLSCSDAQQPTYKRYSDDIIAAATQLHIGRNSQKGQTQVHENLIDSILGLFQVYFRSNMSPSIPTYFRSSISKTDLIYQILSLLEFTFKSVTSVLRILGDFVRPPTNVQCIHRETLSKKLKDPYSTSSSSYLTIQFPSAMNP